MRFALIRKGIFSPYANLSREIYILFAARIVTCLGGFIQPLLTLILTQKLGFSAAETGSFSALLILTQAPAVILGGKLTDRVGRKTILVSCQIAGSFFYLVCALFPYKFLIVPCIMLAADLYTAAAPAYEAMTADLSTPENRQASYSLIYLGINIGLAVSPLFAGLLFQNYLRLMFFLDGATTLVSTLIIIFAIREPDWKERSKSSGQEQRRGNISAFQLLRLFPGLLFVILLTFAYTFTYSQWSFLLPLQFGDFYGKNGAVNYSMMTALNSLTVVLFTSVLTGLTKRRRPLRVIALSGVVFSVSFLMFALVRSMPLFLVAGAIFTFGEILESIHLRPYLANHTPPQYLGRINSFAMFVQGTGNAMGPLLAGCILAPAGYRFTWMFQAAFVFLGAAGMFALDRKEKRTEECPPSKIPPQNGSADPMNHVETLS
ncbi:Multidrug resistance protein MdtG [Caprobacter fermentans]|uniref:Multidrug resistance protein MdtG n=1 Tax=Caproicibacter fermentans TaxID=2576756 RepID=A0A6N8I0B9_9FIRM|nr:MFS transporter [Caproicibacter fermentans]MVB11462.1 Multidrug resistance protein MdtG [Caproicibacter fermentans]